ncbi:MAG: FkbM family methyltransferase [Acidobacteria bacterium]|nr:FkbM family methyltransferase [Acidobacteriota bacterium]
MLVCTWTAAHDYYRDSYREQILANAYFGENGRRELQPIERKYGARHYSRDVEELIIRDYFEDHRDGVFLDVGANHYRDDSNTFYLESQLGWSGVAIDALEEFAADYRVHRPRTQFVAAFVSDVAGDTVRFFVPTENKLVASVSEEFTKREGSPGKPRDVATTTLNVILDQARVSRLDFLSMDIELSEPKALAGFDIKRYRPSLVCIEAHPEVRQQILDYFAQRNYVLVGRYLRVDAHNLYFTPVTSSGQPTVGGK